MRIAVDAMGGDRAPGEIVKGAVEAALRLPDISRIFLVGNEAALRRELASLKNVPDKIEVYPASEVVEMGEAPAAAVRRKKDSSIGRSVDLLKNGEADAVVSAGNTGAVVVAAMLKLRTLEGIDRPAIAAVMPTQGDNPIVLIDAGANIDCDEKLLTQFAVMGSVYSRLILDRESPVVGLLSIGGEASKGNELTKEMFGILSGTHLNFRGNVEGHDLFEGETDVVVCDGFVGNVVLKTTESACRAIGHWLKKAFTANLLRLLGVGFLSGALKATKKKMDPEMYGGAPLLGVNGVCIITHGASSSKAIFHAIRVAGESVHHNINDQIVREMKQVAAVNKASVDAGVRVEE